MKLFNIRDYKILIYGAGGLGRKLGDKLTENKYNFCGYIDKDTTIKAGHKVYSRTEIVDCFNSDELVIIICMHNALWHGDVAKEFYKAGINKIVFLPIGKNVNNQYEEMMETAYSAIVYEDNFDVEIPSYDDVMIVENSITDGLISRDQYYTTFWLPINSIFTNKALEDRGNELTKQFANVSVCAMRPYLGLYKYCDHCDDDVSLYIDAFKSVQNQVDDYTVKEFITDRVELYDYYETKLNMGMDYFINSPAMVDWDDEMRRFYVLEGHHRLIYLAYKGFYYAPVRTTNRAYDIYTNEDTYFEVKKFLESNNIESWYTPIEHPGFFYVGDNQGYRWGNLLNKIYEKLGAYKVGDANVLDCSTSGGLYARSFARNGSKVDCWVPKRNEEPIYKELNRLFMCDQVEIIENIEKISEKKYNFAVYDIRNSSIEKIVKTKIENKVLEERCVVITKEYNLFSDFLHENGNVVVEVLEKKPVDFECVYALWIGQEGNK